MNLSEHKTLLAFLCTVYFQATSADSLDPRDFKGEVYYAGGVGTHACPVYLTNKKDEGYRGVYAQWACGFMSGLNSTSGDKGVLLPPAEAEDILDAWLQEYCTMHPESAVIDGILKLYLHYKHGAAAVPL